MNGQHGGADRYAVPAHLPRPATHDAVPAHLPRPATRVVLVPHHRPGYVGRIHGLQLLVIELSAFGALSALAFGALATTAAVIAAVAIVVLTLARWRGRWLFERRLLVWRYRRRKRWARAATHPEPQALAVLHHLSPDLTVHDVPVAGRQQVGVARDDAGWFAAAAIEPAVMDSPAGVPLDVLAASIADADQAGALAQLVIHALPAHAAGTSPAQQSYQALVGAVGAAPPLAHQDTWVVVRIDARQLAEALGDYNADVSATPAVVASLLRRVVASLRQAGVAARMLDAHGLLAALARSCDAEPDRLREPGAGAIRERWTAWRSGDVSHRSLWIRSWPRHAPALFDALFAVPTHATTVSVILEPDPRGRLVDLTAVVRVAAPNAALDRTVRAVQRAARHAKADLFPLDGEQAPAAYASAPTGGGAR